MTKNLEDLMVNDINPLIELNDIMMDKTADTHIHGDRLWALNCAIHDKLKNLKETIDHMINEE